MFPKSLEEFIEVLTQCHSPVCGCMMKVAASILDENFLGWVIKWTVGKRDINIHKWMAIVM